MERRWSSSAEGGAVLDALRRHAFGWSRPGFLVFDHFLAPARIDVLTGLALMNERRFVPSAVVSSDRQGRGRAGIEHKARRSAVLHGLGPWQGGFVRLLVRALYRALDGLGCARFPVRAVDVQVTATNDGEFFRPHTDNGDPCVRARTITFVLFIHREPKAFEGGQLRFHAPDGEVEPRRNRIVFFPSGIVHEIVPVRCRTRAFADGRLTVNGWFLR